MIKKNLLKVLLVFSFTVFTIGIGVIDVKALVPRNNTIQINNEYGYKIDLTAHKKITEIPNAVDYNVEKMMKEYKERLAREKAEEEARKARIEAEKAYNALPIEEKIKLSCEKYGVDFSIALAIARLETGWFKSDAFKYRNNPGGMSRNEVPIYYPTIRKGVDYFVSNLKKNYFDIGLNTPDEIGKKYCPSNPKWASLVKELMGYGY